MLKRTTEDRSTCRKSNIKKKKVSKTCYTADNIRRRSRINTQFHTTGCFQCVRFCFHGLRLSIATNILSTCSSCYHTLFRFDSSVTDFSVICFLCTFFCYTSNHKLLRVLIVFVLLTLYAMVWWAFLIGRLTALGFDRACFSSLSAKHLCILGLHNAKCSPAIPYNLLCISCPDGTILSSVLLLSFMWEL